MSPPPTDARFLAAKALFLEGVQHHEAQRHAQAEQAFLASLQQLPGRASTLMNLGAAQLAMGKSAEALASLDASLQAEPGDAQAWCHRAEALAALGRLPEAAQDSAKALSLAPGLAAARWQRSRLLAALGQAQEALGTVQPLLQPRPDAAPAWLLAGQMRQSLGQLDSALQHYQQAQALDPRLPRLPAVLGQALALSGQRAQARAVWSDAVAAGLEPELNRYLLAGHGGDGNHPTPGQSPVDYVRALFDPYAEGFEQHLVQTLQYQGHTAVVDAALAAAQANAPPLDHVLDLGCGTGLCGRALRRHARYIEGIDLSPTMVDAARASGAYDAVRQGDIVKLLQQTARQADLVVAADVFIYIGALEPVFDALRQAVAPGALVAFSVETFTAEEHAAHPAGWCLRPSLRYAHAEAYLAALCRHQGWQWRAWQPVALRLEQGQPLAGAVVVMQVPG
ncbi:MAG: methyltransferase [Rubrivivax sp.]|jgi:predicted TPR repeat methyltransferase